MLIYVFPSFGDVHLREKDGMPNDDGNGVKADFFAATWPGLVRAEDAHRNNGRERFRNHQAKTGLGRLQITVQGAPAFRKHERPFSRPQHSNQSFQSAAITAFLIDWYTCEPV